MKTSFMAVLHIGSAKDSTAVLLLGGRIVAALTVNKTTFPEPDPTLDTLKSQVALLDEYIKSRDGSDKIKLSIESQSQLVYRDLKSIISYVNKVAKGVKSIVLLSGFDCEEEPVEHDIPEKVIVKRVEIGSTEHSLKIFVIALTDADRYMVEITTTPDDPNSWKLALNSVPSNKLELTNLTRGVEVFIRVTAGNTHGWGPHSDVTSFIPQ